MLLLAEGHQWQHAMHLVAEGHDTRNTLPLKRGGAEE